MSKRNLYFFQWPSELGGADTRLKNLLQAFSESGLYNLICVPNDEFRLLEEDNIKFLNKLNVNFLRWEDLPEKDDGIAISFCNFRLFSEDWRIKKIKLIGLKFIWSNDMMWRTPEEVTSIQNGLVDASIYTSPKHYQDTSDSNTKRHLEYIIPNYFHFENFKNKPSLKVNEKFTIGKHSRPDKMKFSDNFPLFYQNLNLENPKFRVMGISKEFRDYFSWYNFENGLWDLIEPNGETINNFLSSLDCYVYNSHYKFTETQCRATIESMLLGIPVIAPHKDNFINQIWQGKTGFLCQTYEEVRGYAKLLEKNPDFRLEMGELARITSKRIWSNSERHLEIWGDLFKKL